jgi:GNAT superfamily N-acetyltransferase
VQLIPADVSVVKHILESTQLFPFRNLVEVISVDKSRYTRKEHWLISEEGGDGHVGVAFYAPEVMSD